MMQLGQKNFCQPSYHAKRGIDARWQNVHLEWLQVSNTILGDLSYKTAGSQYKQSGVFEVVKAEAEDTANGGGGASASTEGEGASGSAAGEGQKSSLKVCYYTCI